MDSKPWWQSRTIWLNLVTLVLAFLALPEFVSLLPTTALPYIAFLNAAGNILLRALTNKPLA